MQTHIHFLFDKYIQIFLRFFSHVFLYSNCLLVGNTLQNSKIYMFCVPNPSFTLTVCHYQIFFGLIYSIAILYTWVLKSWCYGYNLHSLFLQDFAHYKSGVYQHITGGVMGGHAVKLIGWGTSEDGTNYWVCILMWYFSSQDLPFPLNPES